MTDLESKRIRIEKDELEIAEKKAQIEALTNKLEEKNARLNDQRDRIIKEAKDEAYEILQKAKTTADETIKRFNKLGMSSRDMEMERSALRESMNKLQTASIKKAVAKANKKATKEDLVPGAKVKVLSFGMEGTVVGTPTPRNEISVQMGAMTSTVKISDLEFISAPVKEADKKGVYAMGKAISISPEINLIGQNSADALENLSKYLDDAYLAHLPSVRIVHGKGSGILRQAVQQFLRKHPMVKSYRLGEFGEGDFGVTIAEFK